MSQRKKPHRRGAREHGMRTHESHSALVYEAEQAPAPAELGGRTANQQCDWAATWDKTRNRERR